MEFLNLRFCPSWPPSALARKYGIVVAFDGGHRTALIGPARSHRPQPDGNNRSSFARPLEAESHDGDTGKGMWEYASRIRGDENGMMRLKVIML